jgi:hypothetical protein
MYKVLSDKVRLSDKLPERARRFEILKRILLGTIYDCQTYQFHEERDQAKKPIPLKDRAPAVDVGLGLVRNTIDTSISFVFGEGRYPEIDCDDQILRDQILDFMKETNLFEIMQNAMFWGSLGSAGIHLFASKNNRIHFKVYCTQYLTPKWQADEPDRLESITEKYIVKGSDLLEMGYRIDPLTLNHDYWFQRIWNDNSEIWYFPWPVANVKGEPIVPQIDESRSVNHYLGFVPWVWLKNLKGGDDIDGASTFQGAIKTCIEIDYLISQGDRGLKYMSDPTLVIINPMSTNEEIFKSASSAIVLGKDGKAEILEMKGGGHSVLLDQVRTLREAALEAMCGNRGTPEKMHATQSGTALEHLWMPMVMMAGDLRNNYGEKGLLQLLNMVMQIGADRQLCIMGKLINKIPRNQPIALRWGRYFEPTLTDLQQQATTLAQLKDSGLMSRETAIKVLSSEYSVENVEAELVLIKAGEDLEDAREIHVAAAVQIKGNRN